MTPQAFIREILTLWEGNHLAQAPALEAIRACLDGLEKPKDTPKSKFSGQDIYEMALIERNSWGNISRATGLTAGDAARMAHFYSVSTSKPWPPRVV